MKKWIKPPVDSDRVRAVAELYNLDLLTAAILTRRNMSEPEQIGFFLEDDERFLHNPFLFPQMERAVERVLSAVEAGEKVLVCGDKDADGITSTVLMIQALRSVGIEPEWRVPVGEETYGLSIEVLEAKAVENITLVITVDCGITEFAEIELANHLGMDVLVFDHHMPRGNEIPAAYAIVNPRIPGDYPFNGLCAAGVVSKFQWALCFAGTELWCEEFCLIHVSVDNRTNPDNNGFESSIVFEALKMRNLVEIQRLHVSQDEGEAGRNEALRFIDGQLLFTYGKANQVPLISNFFGTDDVHVIDIEPDLTSTFPSLKGHSVEKLEGRSRLAQYFPGQKGILSTLGNLLITLYTRRFSESFNMWRRDLDLVAIATLADLMPLLDENRILVGLGINRLNAIDGIKERRTALRELLIQQEFHEGRIDSVEIAWQLCPLINASGRMGRADVAVEFLLSNDTSRITALSSELIGFNKKRRALGNQIWESILPAAYQSRDEFSGRMAIVADNEIPRGITGILASRLQKTLGVTSVVISRRMENASGSIRSNAGINALIWLEAMSSLFDSYGGHPQAGGFQIDRSKVDELTTKCKEWIAETPLSSAQEEPVIIDAELSHGEFIKMGSQGLESLLDRLEPYGKEFQPLTFLTRSVPVQSANLVGKEKSNHLKLVVSLGKEKWPALWWDGADHYGRDIHIGKDIDLVYTIDKDRWRGEISRRLTILEAAPCSS